MILARFTLQQSLFIGFCACLLVALKSMLKLKLGISGHSMLLMSFFYLICYGACGRIGSITACGLMAGLLSMLLGVGKGGPLILIKYVMPAMAMDLTLLIFPIALMSRSIFILAVTGALAWGLKDGVFRALAGMALDAAALTVAISTAQGLVFAIGGIALAIPVLKQLKAHDLINDHRV
ncbi:core component of ECF transporter [Shewanella sp. NIFS-20-20]|uniref:core component of ECF transporter n=1 Tax=Shewanella sp. NIFS-20-20 TaxID=2853806 RepID=UPI001C44E389|nr:core component of ECF transporter [Shewanella sp. NIFS-20-20]MBV7316032.1 core component of ECF transporter [Shewanella sp. NIFS-20-20]